MRARRAFGVGVERLHADTTSFSVHGQYGPHPAAPAASAAPAVQPAGDAELPDAELPDAELPAVIAVTYGYSRDHREDLKPTFRSLH